MRCIVVLRKRLTVLAFPGHPPFRSDNSKELTEMILHLEPLPLRSRGNPHTLSWLAEAPLSRGAQDPNTEPLSAAYRVFIQPPQWRLQEPSKMFTAEKPRWKVRTCKSSCFCCPHIHRPGISWQGTVCFDYESSLHYLLLCSSEWNGQSCCPTLSGHK